MPDLARRQGLVAAHTINRCLLLILINQPFPFVLRVVMVLSQETFPIYNRLRTHIAKNIRELEETRISGGGVMDVLELDSLKILAEEEQNSLNQTITELIARHTITPSMGSSLVNDSMYSQNITLNLIRAAQTIFASAEEDVIQVTQEVMLDKSDLDRIVDQSSTNPGAPVARPE